jgi:hypothetical protein
LTRTRLKRRAALDRRHQRTLVEIVELAADRHAVREPRHRHLGFRQKVGDVMRGGLAVDRGVEREDDLGHLGHVGPRHQRVDREVEQVVAALDILLKTLRADRRDRPWLLALDAEFFGRLDTGAKQCVFERLTTDPRLELLTIFCVKFEKDPEALKAAANDTWIGASSAGNLTIHAFLWDAAPPLW